MEDHLLILQPWLEVNQEGAKVFYEVYLLVRIWSLPPKWYSKRIGRKLLNHFKNCSAMLLSQQWISKKKIYKFRIKVDIMKPLHKYLHYRESGDEERRGAFKYERLPLLSFLCERIGHALRDCVHPLSLDPT